MTDDSRPETGHGEGVPPRPLSSGHAPEPEGARGARSRPVPIPGGVGAAHWPGRSGCFTPERAACIRQRIAERAYESSTVLRVVARRILGSGDLAR